MSSWSQVGMWRQHVQVTHVFSEEGFLLLRVLPLLLRLHLQALEEQSGLRSEGNTHNRKRVRNVPRGSHDLKAESVSNLLIGSKQDAKMCH